MNLLNLEYFLVAAEELNFTRAAKRLYITQQSLSSHIAKLEAHHQVPLFDRGIPMTLTDAGRVLYQSAKEVMVTLEQCDRQLQDIKDFKMGTLSVGVPVTRGTVMLPNLCTVFHQMYPNVQLEIFEGETTTEVEQALFEGKVDIMIGYHPEEDSRIISTPLFIETYVLIAPNALLEQYFSPDRLAAMKGRPQPIKAFANCPFVAQAPSTKGGEVFQQICAESGVTPRIAIVTRNILTEIMLCASGVGLCTVPNSFVMKNGPLGLQNADFFSGESRTRTTVFEIDSPIGSAQLGVHRLRSKLLTQAGKEFITLAESMFTY